MGVENIELVVEIARNEHLINLLSSNISSSIEQKIQEKESRQLKIIGTITAVVLFLGYQGIKEMISSAASASAETAVQKKMGDFEVPAILATLSTVLERVENKNTFSTAERNEMIASLERLSKASKEGHEVVTHPSFLRVLEKVIDTLSSSDNNLLMDRAYDLFPDECIKSQGIVETLLSHYGQQSAVGTGSIKHEASKRFGVVERSASTHKLMEVALAHRFLIDFAESASQKNMTLIIDQVASLNESDKERAFKLWYRYAKESWVRRHTGESTALKKLTREAIAAYQPMLVNIGFDLSEMENNEKDDG